MIMGATPSKKRKERKRQKDTEEVLAAVANLKEVYAKSALHPYRRSQLLDVRQDLSTLPDNYLKGQTQDDPWWSQSETERAATLPIVKRGNSGARSLLFDQVNVDEHPVLSNLQNKQNARLENMEQRIGEIRRHAMEAAAAAHKRHRVQGHSQGQKQNTLSEQTKPKAARNLTENFPQPPGATMNISDDDDSGEVIPVRILTSRESRQAQIRQREFQREKSPPDPLSLDLLWKGSPLIVALLPIILPVLLLSVIMKSISQSYQDKKKR